MDSQQRIKYLIRGIANKCPRCGKGAILKTLFARHDNCPHCRMQFDREQGFFSAAMAINYAIVCALYLFPLLLIWFLGWLPGIATIVLCFMGAMGIPILTYRYSQSLWLGLYYFLTADNFPENETRKN